MGQWLALLGGIMPSNPSIVLLDGKQTPTTHTFDPTGIFGDIAKYQNKAQSFYAGRETAQLRLRHNQKVRTVSGGLRVPRIVDETMNGVTAKRVVDYGSANVELIVPVTWSGAEAKDLRVLAGNLLLSAIVAAMLEDGEFVW